MESLAVVFRRFQEPKMMSYITYEFFVKYISKTHTLR